MTTGRSVMTNTTVPKETSSPGCTWTDCVTRQPLSLVPLVEPRSDSSQPSSSLCRWACQRDTLRSATVKSQDGARPIVNFRSSCRGRHSGRGSGLAAVLATGTTACQPGGAGGSGWDIGRSGGPAG